MKKLLTQFFNNWLYPIGLFVAAVLLFLISFFLIQNDAIHYVILTLVAIGLVGLLISTIYQLGKRRWLQGLLTGLMFGGTLACIVFFLAVFTLLVSVVDGDHWADNLTIPSNIELHTPVNLTWEQKRPDSILFLKKKKPDFILYNSFQPGLYEYDIWLSKLESGTVYFKAYEITQNVALSNKYLLRTTAIPVYNPSDSIIKYSTQSDFTIYEGDWGKPYAARFEVWFKPDDGSAERKLMQRNYKIEGWMH